MKLGIAKGTENSYKLYVEACKELSLDYEVIDILAPDWIEKVKESQCDGFLLRPPCDYQERKNIYDEKVYFINKVLEIPVYPSYESIYIYENKRAMAYWLETHNFPFVKTYMLSRKKDALSIIDNLKFPIVIKSNIGAGGKFVNIVKSKAKAKLIIYTVFGFIHSKLTIGFFPWGKLKGVPIPLLGFAQKHYIIIQAFYKIKLEWRIIKIGDSYFGHQKLLKGNKASGSDLVGWVKPPIELLQMAHDICNKGSFNSMAIDIFETIDGKYYVNELQALFGSYDNSQMYIDGKPGRFTYKNGKFLFEEGYFNMYGSCILYVKDFVNILK